MTRFILEAICALEVFCIAVVVWELTFRPILIKLGAKEE